MKPFLRTSLSACFFLLFLWVSLITAPLISVKAETYLPTAASLKAHVEVLASDSLEGREVGEPGELKAAHYIARQFELIGLEPGGSDGSYLQPFEFTKKIAIGSATRLSINGQELPLKVSHQPLKNSASMGFVFTEVVPVGYGITVEAGDYNDYDGKDVAGKAVLITRFSPSADDYPHTDFSKYESLTDKIDNALKHDVAGIFFVTPEGQDDTISVGGFAHVSQRNIPIIWLKQAGLKQLGLAWDSNEPFRAEGLTDLVRVRDTAYNVIGLLRAETDTAICIGSHYDHLGWGTAASLYRGDEPMIHYGADDNGSGTTTMIELARQYASRKDELNYSRLFIAFTGEERGLLGSSYFVKQTLDDPEMIRMMVNLDMIGRLNEQDNGLAILGTGTCAEFKTYFDSLPDPGFKLTFKESGIGPSDHTPFYNRDIPVLFFFTGAHKDYHRPSDSWDKLDYDGLAKVTAMISETVDYFDSYPQSLTFQKVKVSDPGSGRRKFSVSLGVMPDYVAEVKGLKIDGVTPGRVAEKAGFQVGDILIKMGEYDISDIYGYMNALGKFKKGDSIQVLVERGTDTLSLDVRFD